MSRLYRWLNRFSYFLYLYFELTQWPFHIFVNIEILCTFAKILKYESPFRPALTIVAENEDG